MAAGDSARDEAELLRLPGLLQYGAVIVDEVQDLTLTGLRFLAALARGGQLLLIGDGQQSVYPGGFNLSEAGINITGRSSVLKVDEGLRHHPPSQRTGESDTTYAERLERFRRELFVGMTRARDGLWLGYLPR